MTEKRFTLTERKCYFTSLIFDNQENEKLGSDEAMEYLNALHEENMCLKGEVAHYKLILMSLEKEARRISENWKVRK